METFDLLQKFTVIAIKTQDFPGHRVFFRMHNAHMEDRKTCADSPPIITDTEEEIVDV